MSRLDGIKAWTALDSRGWPTVAVRAEIGDAYAVAIAPAGASTGAHEDPERRDGGEPWQGRGVSEAVAHVNGPMAALLRGVDASDPWAVDACLAEGVPPGGWGGNTTVAVTLALVLAEAASRRIEPWKWIAELTATSQPTLPLPMVNIVSGGAHAGRAVDIQDVLVIPVGARSFGEAIEMAAAVRRAVAKNVEETDPLLARLVADEGGVVAIGARNQDALEMVWSGIQSAGLEGDIALALDVAATQFYSRDGYHLATEGSTLTSEDFAAVIRSWSQTYPIVSVEDPFAEDDWSAWRAHAVSLGIGQVIGDDLIATGTERLRRAVDEGCANAVLVKPNQAGSIARALDVLNEARSRGIATVVSARSGDTEQDWLADLAVGSAAGQIKVGSLHRSERTAKWNRLLELESRFSADLPYAGAAALAQVTTSPAGGSR